MATPYSFRSLVGSITHPLVGTYIFAGNIGLGRVAVEMSTDRTVHDIAADGSVMVSYVAGDNGQITIEVQQTSDLHAYLLNWFNTIRTASNAGDVVNWAAASIALRNISDGGSHNATGVSPSKVAGKEYQQQGQKITWTLMAANISNQ